MVGGEGIATSPHIPQSNGKWKRYSETLKKKVLKKLCVIYEKHWDETLTYGLFAYRKTPHDQTGFLSSAICAVCLSRGTIRRRQGCLLLNCYKSC